MPSVKDPDPQGIIQRRAEGKAESEFEGEMSVAQILNYGKGKEA